MGYPVKVTYKKSSKKGAKRYTKNYSTVITVKNPSLSVKAAATTLTVGETAKLTVKKTPSSATVKYSSSDDAVASVSKGVITANGVGSAVITTKLTYGTKTISKNITVKVTEAVDDGISAALINQFDSVNYPDVVLTNPDLNKERTAVIRAYYGKNGKGVNDRNLVLKLKSSKSSKVYTTTRETDANGVAYFPIEWSNYECDKTTYTITASDDETVKTDGSFTFAYIGVQNIVNVNGREGKKSTDKLNLYYDKKDGNVSVRNTTDYKAAGYDGLVVAENDSVGGTKSDKPITSSDGVYTKIENTLYKSYVSEYVNSQQVSPAGTTKHQVGFIGGKPYIVMPGDGDDLSGAKDFQQDVNYTSGKYDTYADSSYYLTLKVDPSELTYATVNFTDVTLSKYTRLQIEAYKSEDDAKAVKDADGNPLVISGSQKTLYGALTQNSFAYQIPINTNGSQNGYNSICIKVTLKSQGQVDTASNLGYTIKDITGVYKKQSSSGDTREVLKGATVTWKAATPAFGPELPLDTSRISTAIKADNVDLTGKDSSTGKIVERVTYRVPVFPYTGNAVITTYDKTGAVVAYYACPTVNSNRKNENDLDYAGAKYMYRISEKEAFNPVGDVSQNNDVVTVNSTEAGVTYLEGTISGLEDLFDATNSKLYTSVQWNPVENATAGQTGAVAFAGQEVTVTAQLVDSNKNPVAKAGEPITFSYYDEAAAKSKDIDPKNLQPMVGYDNKIATVLDVKDSTDSKGQATLKVSAANAITAIKEIKASTKSYNVVITVNGISVDQLSLYWIEAKPAFGQTASQEPSLDKMDQVTEEDIDKNSKVCEPGIGENWEYAFKVNDVKLPKYGAWSEKTVGIKNVKIDVTADEDSKGTVTPSKDVNGMVLATSSEPGETTLNAKVDGSAFDNNGVIFVVDNKDNKSVGVGTTSFTNKQKLVINWQTSGLSGSFVSVNGVNVVTDAAIDTFDLYFKVADKFGNGINTEPVTIKSNLSGSIKNVYGFKVAGNENAISGGSIVTQFVEEGNTNPTKVYADKNGIIKISLDRDAAGRIANGKEMITVTLNGVPYTQTITWRNNDNGNYTTALDVTTKVPGNTVEESNPYKTYADNSKIVLAFKHEILASSVNAKQFTVGRKSADGTKYEKCEIGSVSVSGKYITITLKHPITDGVVRPFVVKMTSVDINSVTYNVTSEDGYVISSNDAKYYIVNDKLTLPEDKDTTQPTGFDL